MRGINKIIIFFPVAGGGPEKANPVRMAITSGPGVQKPLNFMLREKSRRKGPEFSENVRKTIEKLRKT